MKKLVIYSVSIFLLAFSQLSNAGYFKIQINNTGGLSDSQAALFADVSALWESLLTGIQAPENLVLTINASGEYIDGVSGILGSAGPSYVGISSGYTYTTLGVMRFDTADLDAMEANGSLFAVIFHEMAHVMGFGTLWNTDSWGSVFTGTQSVYEDGSGQYTGAYALAVYQAEFDPTATYVPVELDGGSGTADGHWDESWAGGFQEIMTGWLDAGVYISATTIASFADIGYTTIVTHATEVAAPATVGIFLFGSLLAFRRRKAR